MCRCNVIVPRHLWVFEVSKGCFIFEMIFLRREELVVEQEEEEKRERREDVLERVDVEEERV